MEGLQTPDGVKLDVDAAQREFAAAMAAPPSDQDAPPLSRKPVRDDPSAEKPKRTRGPRKPSQTRTESVPPAAKLSEAQLAVLHAKRVKSVEETAGMLGAGFLVAAKVTNQAAFKADAYTFQAAANPLGEAAANVAAVDPAFARYIDKQASGKITAYLGMATVALSLGAQMAANHGLVKPGFLSTVSPADVIAHYETDPEAAPDDADPKPE